MKLQNPFPQTVRLLYLDWWECFMCGENGQRSGGLEIHHILGRVSSCAFNSSCLCKKCHAHVGHSENEHRRIFLRTMQFLFSRHYQPTKQDLDFFEKNHKRLESKELHVFLNSQREHSKQKE